MTLSKLVLVGSVVCVAGQNATTTTAAAGNTTAAAANTTAAATTAAATTAAATTAAAATTMAAANTTAAAGGVAATSIGGIENTVTIPCAASVCGGNSTRRNLQATAAQTSACNNYLTLVLGNSAAKTAYAAKMLAAEPLASNAQTCEVSAIALAGCAVVSGSLQVKATYTLQVTPKAGVTNAALQTAVTSGTAALQTAAAAAGAEAVSTGIANMSAADKTTFATSIGKTAADITTAWATSVGNTVTADTSSVTTTTITVTTAAPAASSSVSAAFGLIAAMFSAALLF